MPITLRSIISDCRGRSEVDAIEVSGSVVLFIFIHQNE
jgi:hypothetical protein